MPHFHVIFLATLFCAPPDAVQENLTTIDYHQAEIQWLDGRWRLRAGSVWIKDFDRHESEAREALRLIRELKLTQFGTIGYPRPVLEYWLSDGHAPTNSLTGLRTTAFERDSLRIEQVQGQWCLRDTHRVLFSFGYHEDDARQALAIIRKHGFNQIGYLGRPAPVMMYFLSGQNGLAQESSFAGSATMARTTAGNNPFPRHVLHKKGEQEKPADSSAVSGQTLPDDLPALPTLRQLATRGPGAAASSEDRVAVDWRHVEVRHDGRDWKLVYGNYMVANAGPSESDAHVALTVIQHYHLTEHCLIGRPNATFSYFLASGQAPRGLCFGAHNTPFRPEMLSVQKHGEEWVIAEGSRPLFHFGDKDHDARDALQAIRQYRFDCLCSIGSAEKPLTFLVRTR